jgi:uncharacterized protein (DUF433 family)
MTYLMDRITVDPEMCGGRPCIRGMRIRVVDVLDLLAAGLSRAEILDEMPDLEDADIDAALRFARSRVDHPILAASGSGSTHSFLPSSPIGCGPRSMCVRSPCAM